MIKIEYTCYWSKLNNTEWTLNIEPVPSIYMTARLKYQKERNKYELKFRGEVIAYIETASDEEALDAAYAKIIEKVIKERDRYNHMLTILGKDEI